MTRIKICGLRKTDDALVAIDSGADFIGFVFVEGVRRQITLKQADVMLSDIRRLRTTCPARLVGLFANQPVKHVNDVVKLCDLDLVQLCGQETIRYWSSIDVQVIKQVKVEKDQNPTMVELKVHLLAILRLCGRFGGKSVSPPVPNVITIVCPQK